MPNPTREQAQQRADRIHAFEQELMQLQVDQVVDLSADQQVAIRRYHQQLLEHYTTHLDIDADPRSRQLSLGMRIASLFGALALATGVFFLFYRFWGLFSETGQVAILLASALGSVLLTFWVQARDASGYYVKLAALLCFVCFVLNLTLLGQVFNVTPSDKALVPWAVLAFVLAYYCRQRLLLAVGILCLGAFVAARVNAWGGHYWLGLGERPENVLPVAVLLFSVPLVFDQARFSGFASLYRSMALLALYLPVLALSYWGEASYLPGPSALIEVLYRALSFVLAGVAIWQGVRRGWPEVVNVSLVFAVIFLYAGLFDWWWGLLPSYLFFLLLGALSLLLLVVLQRWRKKVLGGAP